MKSDSMLRYARRVLAARHRIVTDHVRQRNQIVADYVAMRETVDRQRLAIAQHRLGVIQTLAQAQKLIPAKPVDPAQDIADRHRRARAHFEARADLRADVDRRMRSQAAQAALDRAAFVAKVKEELPEELWDETIDAYDRQVYEAGEGGLR